MTVLQGETIAVAEVLSARIDTRRLWPLRHGSDISRERKTSLALLKTHCHMRLLLGQVLPASVAQRNPEIVGSDQGHLRLIGTLRKHAADRGEGNARDRAGDACAGGSGKEKFVVLTAVQGRFQRVGQEPGQRVDGHGGFRDLGMEAGAGAKVGEISGQAIAKVDGGGRERAEASALGEPRLGEKVGVAGCGFP